MIRFVDFPLVVQNFLSDWMDEIILQNAEHEINKPELSEMLVRIFDHFAVAVRIVLDEVQSEEREDGAPFHLTIGPEGFRFRSNKDHSLFSDANLFPFKYALVRINEWEQDIQHVLRESYRQLNICMKFLEEATRGFLQTLSDQVSLTCIFPVPPPDGAPHENVAVFKWENNQLKVLCESNTRHQVIFQG
ncbi:hypothetical protein JXQ70_06995 [bacterium]|nr:hypothetical protein [bacterium]